MDDQRFGNFLIQRGIVPRERLAQLYTRLRPGSRFADALVQEGLLSPEGVRALWAEACLLEGQAAPPAEAEDGTATAPLPDTVRFPQPPEPAPPTPPGLAPPEPLGRGGTTRVDVQPQPLPLPRPGADTTRVGMPYPHSEAPADQDDTLWGTGSNAASPGAHSGEGGLPGTGDRIAQRYRIEAVLGRGGMGAVFRALDEEKGERVAIKVLLPERATPVIMERFEREAQLAARVDKHGGVVRVFAFGTSLGVHYCVMELVEGCDLDQLFAQEDVSERRVAQIVERAARSMSAVHAEGVLHRDLKPANILLAGDDQPKIADFGLARDDTLERLTQTGELLGTPSYMAPEQVDNASGVDRRADVYSLGAILYRGLSGQPPFQGPVAQVIREVLMEDPPLPRTLRPSVSADLEAICLKAMAKRPMHRYTDAEALADDLAKALRGEEVSARPQTSWVRFRRRYARGERRAVTWVRAAMGLALVAFAASLGGAFLGARAWANAALEDYRAFSLDLDRFALGEGEGELDEPRVRALSERLERVLPALVENPELLASARQRLAAHLRLHALLEGGGLSSTPPGTGPAADAVQGIALAAEAQRMLRDPKGAADGARLLREALGLLRRASEDPSASAGTKQGATALRRSLPIGPRLRRRLKNVLRRAPGTRSDTLRAELESIAKVAMDRGADLEILRGAKLTALQEVKRKGEWERFETAAKASMRAGSQGTAAVEEILHRFGTLLNTEPAVSSEEAGLRSTLDGLVEVAIEELDRAYAKGVDSKEYHESLQSLIRLEQGIYYEVDPTHEASPRLSQALENELIGNRPEARDVEFALINVRAIRPGQQAPSLKNLFLLAFMASDQRTQIVDREGQWRWVLEKLKGIGERRPRSRALRFCKLVVLRELEQHKRAETAEAYQALAAEVVDREAHPGLFDDVQPHFVAVARILRAKALNSIASQVPRRQEECARAALAEVLAAAEQVPSQYASSIYLEGARAKKTLGAQNAELLEWWTQGEAYYARRLRQALEHKVRGGAAADGWREGLVDAIRSRARVLLNLDRFAEGAEHARRGALEARKLATIHTKSIVFTCLAMEGYALVRLGQAEEGEAIFSEHPQGVAASSAFCLYWIQSALHRQDPAAAQERLDLALRAHPTEPNLSNYQETIDHMQKKDD